MKKVKKNLGWCIIIYGFSGAGKSEISKKLKIKLKRKLAKLLF